MTNQNNLRPALETIDDFEQHCRDRAAYWTAVRGRAHNRTRETFENYHLAREYAAGFGDGRTMLYAVTLEGRSAHIENA